MREFSCSQVPVCVQVASKEGCGGSGGQRSATSVQGWGGFSAEAATLPCRGRNRCEFFLFPWLVALLHCRSSVVNLSSIIYCSSVCSNKILLSSSYCLSRHMASIGYYYVFNETLRCIINLRPVTESTSTLASVKMKFPIHTMASNLICSQKISTH